MEYGIYAAVFILLLGSVALVVWGTRKSGAKAQVMSSLDRLDTYDSQAYRRTELDQPAIPASAGSGGASAVRRSARDHPVQPDPETGAEDRVGRPPRGTSMSTRSSS